MPLYRCAVREGLTTEAQRAQIAKEVVRIHCGVTAAPASFVHAFFAETPAHGLPEGKLVFVFGSIRWGRTDEQKARIVSELSESVPGHRLPRRGRGGGHRRHALQVDHGRRRAAPRAGRRGRVARAPSQLTQRMP